MGYSYYVGWYISHTSLSPIRFKNFSCPPIVVLYYVVQVGHIAEGFHYFIMSKIPKFILEGRAKKLLEEL